jgi:predicted PurR-regulated permease PerM
MPPDLSRADTLTLALITLIVIGATIAFWPLLDVVILSFSLAVVIMPLQRTLTRWMSEAVAALVATIIVGVLFFGSVAFTLTVIYENADYLATIVSAIIGAIRMFQVEELTALLPIPPNQIAEWLGTQVTHFSEYIADMVRQLPLLLVKMIIFFLSLYMFVFKGDAIRDELMAHLPRKVRFAVHRMSEMTVNTLYAIYVVHISTSVLTFILALPFFYFLGYDHVVFYSLMAAIFQLIPIIGPSFLMVFLAIYALSIGDVRSMALIALIGYPVVCAFPDIYLRPVMMGMRASIHPVLMWIGFFGGLAVMGIVGFVLGPLFIALIVSGYHIFIDELKAIRLEAVD